MSQQASHQPAIACLLAIACVLMTGCPDVGPVHYAPYPDPPYAGGAVQDDALQLDISQAALDAWGAQLAGVLPQFVETRDGTAFIPLSDALLPESSANLVSFRNNSHVIVDVAALQRGLRVQWLDTNAAGEAGVAVQLDDVPVGLDAVMLLKIAPPVACHMHAADGQVAAHVGHFSIELRWHMDAVQRLRLRVEHATLALTAPGLGGLAVQGCDGVSDSTCHDPACDDPDANCADNCANIAEQMQGIDLTEMLPGLEDGISARVNQMLNMLPPGHVSVQTQTALWGELAALAAAQPLHLYAALQTPQSAAARGLTWNARLGTSSTPAVCAADSADEAPTAESLAGTPLRFAGTMRDGTPYDTAVALSQAALTQAFWNLFQSGAMCLAVDSEALQQVIPALQLRAELLMNLLPALQGLASPDAPILLTLHARHAPKFHFGTGGKTDPLLQVTVDDLALGVYLMFDNAHMRIAELRAQVQMAFDLERGPTGLELVAGHIGVKHVAQEYNALTADAELAPLVQTLLDAALRARLPSSWRLPMPDVPMLALPMTLQWLGAERLQSDSQKAYGALYARFCPTDACDTPAPAAPDVHVLQRDTATVWLAVGPSHHAPRFQVAVDGGLWSITDDAPGGRLRVESPGLHTVGPHSISVRARTGAGAVSAPTTVAVLVEPSAPDRTASHAAAAAVTAAADNDAAGGCQALTPAPWVCIVAALTLWRMARRHDRAL